MNARRQEVTVITHSAVTVLNAIYHPFGSALGIHGPTRVTVRASRDQFIDVTPKEAGISLIKACLETFELRFKHSTSRLAIITNSSLPPERGLKTSSAVASALMIALAKFFNVKMSFLEALVLGAQASIKAGVSVSGALDDAIACTLGGWNLVRNRAFEISFLKPMPIIDMDCLLLIPEERRPKAFFGTIPGHSENHEFQVLLTEARRAAERGDVITAIRLNTLAYTTKLEILGDEIINFLISHEKTVVAGLNGGGPSMFVFCKKKDQAEFLKDLSVNFPEFKVKLTTFRPIQGDLNAFIN